MNSVDDLAPDCLGKAGLVYEHTLVSCFNSFDEKSICVNINLSCLLREKTSSLLLRMWKILNLLLY